MDAEPAPMGQGRPFGAARWSGAGMREARRALARRNGFGYFPRKESDPAVKAGTKRHSTRDNGYAHRQQPHRRMTSPTPPMSRASALLQLIVPLHKWHRRRRTRRWSNAGGREARRAQTRSNGFGYFPRKESNPAVKAGTKQHSTRDNGYVQNHQRQRRSRASALLQDEACPAVRAETGRRSKRNNGCAQKNQ